ncbi:MAG: molybdopterin-dependent oxidoreductase [Kofleriaceae bacterium]
MITRRDLLQAPAVLWIAFRLRDAMGAPASTPDAFVRIGDDGRVTLIVPYVEMGQGAYTSQAQILADELEVDFADVTVEPAPPNEKLYSSPLFGGQITGGSGSLRGSWLTLRTAGAAARTMLIAAAAMRWKVKPEACHARQGRVVHDATKRELAYRELVAEAAHIAVPTSPVVKTAEAYRWIGTPVKRVDTPAKINGSAIFGIDARPPGLRYAVVRPCPIINGTLASVDPAPALAVKGVRQVVQLADSITVVADHTAAARKGLAALAPQWHGDEQLSTAALVAATDAALDQPGTIAKQVGDVGKAEDTAARKFEATVRMPMLAHVAMEPLNCTVHVTADRCEVWVGSQVLARAQRAAAESSGLPIDRVIVHNHYLGGGFGRRLEFDYVARAVAIAKQITGPVKILWAREEDVRDDFFRYHNHSRVTVGLDAHGMPVSWRHRVAGPNIMKRFLPIYQSKEGVDLDVVDAASGPYELANVLVDFSSAEAPPGLHTGNWRGVGVTRNAVVVESVIDQLAHDAGVDPVEYRKRLLGNSPRPLHVLEQAVAKSDWKAPLPAREGRGIAVFSGFDSHLAMVVHVRVDPDGKVHVLRVTCAVDCGVIVNPDIVRAQIEGGINFGLSAVLWGQITVAHGRIEQSNFHDVPVIRIHQAPAIEVHLVASKDNPGGVGEPGTSGAIAATANAVFAATGKRAWSLPLEPSLLKV